MQSLMGGWGQARFKLEQYLRSDYYPGLAGLQLLGWDWTSAVLGWGFCVLLLTIANLACFPPCSAPGRGPWLWRGIRPELLTLANGGPSAGVPLGFDWFQTSGHLVMTSEHLDHTFSLPLSLSLCHSLFLFLRYLQNGNQHAALPPKWWTPMRSACHKQTTTCKPHIRPVSSFDVNFQASLRWDFIGCRSTNDKRIFGRHRFERWERASCSSCLCSLPAEIRGIQRLLATFELSAV